jgi:hypothetical protein
MLIKSIEHQEYKFISKKLLFFEKNINKLIDKIEEHKELKHMII